MPQTRSTEVFFIIDGLKLEAQGCLLAPTLKKHLSRDQKAVAYVRQDYRPKLTSLTEETLTLAGVELREIPDTGPGDKGPWLKPYPHGNKILAATCPRDCDVSVFLDTDTVLVEPVDFIAELGDALIGACVSDYASVAGTDEDWERYYAAFDLPPPQERVQFNRGRRIHSFPYFNAGMVIFRERFADGAPAFVGRDWLNVALQFERKAEGNYDRINIDQFTLPILGYQRAAPIKTLDQRLNFNIQGYGHGEGMAQSIAHYHQIGVLWAHNKHGRMALECLKNLVGDDIGHRFVDAYGSHAKRKRMKQHMAALSIA